MEFTFPNASIFVEESITEHGVGLNVNERQPQGTGFDGSIRSFDVSPRKPSP